MSPFKRAHGCLIVAALTLFVTTAWAQEIKYPIPDGFLNLSPGAPAENFAKVPTGVVAQALISWVCRGAERRTASSNVQRDAEES